MNTSNFSERRPEPPSIDVNTVSSIDVKVSMPEAGRFHFSFAEHYLFPNPNAVFVTLRDALTSFITQRDQEERNQEAEPVFILIRYASRVFCSNMPMLHSPADRVSYIDPLLPYRDIVMEVARTKNVSLFAFPSRHYFFRPRTKPEDFPANPRPASIPSIPVRVQSPKQPTK